MNKEIKSKKENTKATQRNINNISINDVKDCKNCKYYAKVGCSNKKWACCVVRNDEGFVIEYNHHEFKKTLYKS